MSLSCELVIEAVEPTTLPVVGTHQRFPVRRIWCVGRNYAAHAREMGSDPTREPPFFFAKPTDAVLPVEAGSVGEMSYPPQTANLHHEVELVAAIGKAGADIAVEQALEHVWGYGIGLDMTRRDLQFALRDKGRPWELGKAFDQSAPIGPIHPVSAIGHPARASIWIDVDGQRRQHSDIDQMTWSVAEVIAHLSRYVALQPGDLIMTGTPEGVAAVVPGQTLSAGIDGLGTLQVHIAERGA
ncbi:fumarylpyruvate hydrolase [Sphaerotilus hippei]|uniref:Fumarylpyruvate hydrolase n=1 Tax=Sphaerotilus hippei TaxID=744406 RepID=A0A318H6F3_9BURK|nr:fumarylacetoacetate hydrolase family protein [Sphaerotilus hippei]PXW94976.1 fumarylpyruvate hydrolase [Sphaerotilus hippei]